jgi:PAS domain S-box-containing protein
MKLSRRIPLLALLLGLVINLITILVDSAAFDKGPFLELVFTADLHEHYHRLIVFLSFGILGLLAAYIIRTQETLLDHLSKNEAHLRQLFENVPIAYQSLDENACILNVNQAWLDMLDYPRDQVVGRWIGDFLMPDQAPLLRERFKDFARQGAVHKAEFVMIRRDGTPIDVCVEGKVVYDSDRQFSHTQCVVQDITSRKRKEHALFNINRQSRLLLKAAGEGICGLDREGKFVFLNPAAESMLGFTAQDLMWQPHHALIHHSRPDGSPYPVEDCPIQQTLQTGQITRGRETFWHKDGTAVPVDYTSTPIMEAEAINGVVITFRDVSEQIAQAQALTASETRYRNLFHNNHASMLIIDPTDGAIVDCNPAACAYYGYSRTALTGCHIQDINTLSSEEVQAEMALARAEQRKEFHFRHRLASGEVRDVEVFSGPIRIDNRELLYSIIHDITERTAAEEAWRLDEARLETLLALSRMQKESVAEIADFAVEHAIKLTNSRVGFVAQVDCELQTISLIGWSQHKDNQADQPKIDYSDNKNSLWAQVVEQREPLIINDYTLCAPEVHHLPGGHTTITRLLVVPVMDQDRVVGLGAVANKAQPYDSADERQLQLMVEGVWQIIRQREGEKRRIQVTLEQERRNILTGFIRDVSHEFRTPLSVINTATYMLSRHADHPIQQRHIKHLQIQSDYLSKLVERMVTMLRLDNPKEAGQSGVHDINAMLETLIEQQAHLFPEADLALTVALCDKPLPIQGYAGQLHQAFAELLANAREYTPAGGQVTVSTARHTNTAVVTITDTGIGITDDDMPQIFNNFYRADRARTERHAGMGLPIVQKIINMHQGVIDVTSVPGKGSTFAVRLPIAAAD